jgi:hypothetical protein
MKETLKVLNQMVKAGVVSGYAIGGAVAAIYYLEPFDTADLDIFVQIETTGSAFMILAPIYEFATARGYKVKMNLFTSKACPFNSCPCLIR